LSKFWFGYLKDSPYLNVNKQGVFNDLSAPLCISYSNNHYTNS